MFTSNNPSSTSNLESEAKALALIKSLLLQKWIDNKNGLVKDHSESFGHFYERWLVDEDQNLADLRLAITQLSQLNNESSQSRIQQLVTKVMRHYEDYYRVKSSSIERDVIYMMNAPWLTHLENTFLWIGGWRVTITFHLLYSVVGLQFEAQLTDFLQGSIGTTRDLGSDLTSTQLIRIDELQKETVRQERELSETLASLQETIADSSLVQLSHLATQLSWEGCDRYDSINEQVKLNFRVKENKLKQVFFKADDLRLTTLKTVVDILSPIQAAHFLIAAAELHLRLNEWGHYNYNHHDDIGN
ncbi:Protein DOG1-like 1 [Bienertia sinuspersici]